MRGRWWLAAIRPGGRRDRVWAIPKGHVGRNEPAEATAVREVAEETGLLGEPVGKLGDVRYVYTRGGQRIFKVVSFYLLRYRSGRIGDLPADLAFEVDEARWLPLDDAPALLTYRGEKQMVSEAAARLRGEAL